MTRLFHALPMAVLYASSVWANEYEIVAPSDQTVILSNGEITAHLQANGCEPGHSEACSVTRQRADYVLSQKFGHGDRVSYSWEMKVSEPFIYNAVDIHLYPVRFLNNENEPVFRFFLGAKYGFEARRQMCFSPEEFGQWHKVEIRVVWDSTTRENLSHVTPGSIQVWCNGVETFSVSGRPNIQAGEEVQLALGLDASLTPAEGDRVSVTYRNVSISDW